MRSVPQLFCLAWLLAIASPSVAQGLDPQAGPFGVTRGNTMPAWVVPVLRLVSATHVEPTTGVVLSDSGLVLVPADFASIGDEIIVLDGGTDILRNGRPARLEKIFASENLAVLQVQGLKRIGAPFSAATPGEGSQVLLTAFPPAEQIAEGAPPLKQAATIIIFEEIDRPSISGETPLPNVTGPLLDACGNLAGVSLAAGVQSMAPSPSTAYQWKTALMNVLRELQVVPDERNCPPLGGDGEAAPESEPAPELEEQTLIVDPEPVEEMPAEETGATEVEAPVEQEPEDTASDEPATADEDIEEQLPELGILPPYESDEEPLPAPETEAAEETSSGGWLWLLAALVLLGLGFALHGWRRFRNDNTAVSSDPPTEPLSVAVPPLAQEAEWTQAALDSLLILRGTHADGSAFEVSSPVSAQAINLVIGRGENGIRLDSAAVSRQHARLNGTAKSLTLSDLGSNNGTSINGVPCMEGEIMFLEPGDTIILGDTRFSIEIRPSTGEQAE
jgi:hypothetical protein